jgi:hypothetical protein
MTAFDTLGGTLNNFLSIALAMGKKRCVLISMAWSSA